MRIKPMLPVERTERADRPSLAAVAPRRAETTEFSRALDSKLRPQKSEIVAAKPDHHEPHAGSRSEVGHDVRREDRHSVENPHTETAKSETEHAQPRAKARRATDETHSTPTAVPTQAAQPAPVPRNVGASRVGTDETSGDVAIDTAKTSAVAKPETASTAPTGQPGQAGQQTMTADRPLATDDAEIAVATTAAPNPAEAVTTLLAATPVAASAEPKTVQLDNKADNQMTDVTIDASTTVTSSAVQLADAGEKQSSDGGAHKDDHGDRSDSTVSTAKPVVAAAWAPAVETVPAHKTVSQQTVAVEAPDHAHEARTQETLSGHTAAITVGEGEDRVTLRIHAGAGGVRVAAHTESESLASALHHGKAELARSLDHHGLSLAELETRGDRRSMQEHNETHTEAAPQDQSRSRNHNRKAEPVSATSTSPRRDILA